MNLHKLNNSESYAHHALTLFYYPIPTSPSNEGKYYPRGRLMWAFGVVKETQENHHKAIVYKSIPLLCHVGCLELSVYKNKVGERVSKHCKGFKIALLLYYQKLSPRNKKCISYSHLQIWRLQHKSQLLRLYSIPLWTNLNNYNKFF
jgi:hypothetical protein